MSDIKRRTDLEALRVKFPNYIGTQIYPWFLREQSAGVINYYKLSDDFNVQKGRDTAAVGSINTGMTLAGSHMSYQCGEARARARMSYTEIKSYKSQAKADVALGKKSKRAWFNDHEQAVADILMKKSGTDVKADPVTGIDTAVADLVDLAAGPVALCLSRYNFVKLKKNATIIDRMKMTGIAINAGGDPRSITAEQMAIIFGVDKVLIGPDKQWFKGVGSSYNGNAALVVLPDEYVEPDEEPQLGRTVSFDYNSDTSYFVMESFHDNLTDADYVDAKGLYVIKTFNSELAKTLTLFNGVDDSSLVDSSVLDSSVVDSSVIASSLI